MKVLVTGGLGFIGSHTVAALIEAQHQVVIVDNLINSKIQVLDKLQKLTGTRLEFYEMDVRDKSGLETIFLKDQLDGVIHLAGLKSVGESVLKPLDYYENNILSTIVLTQMCLDYKVDKLVFSSSATVYGDQPAPFKEEMSLGATTNPYGETKKICERILTDSVKVNKGFSVILLRYFNPIGAHESGLIGEEPNGIPNNLMPLIVQAMKRETEPLQVYGNDYDTPDGTCIRDYTHVVDLAKGHLKALEKIKEGCQIYNLGTGKGTSVLELIHAFERITGEKVPIEMGKKRLGDIGVSYADVSKAKQELGWQAEKGLDAMVADTYRFVQKTKGTVPFVF